MGKLTVTSLERTCHACPAQWEGHISDGRMFYIRYRHGCFTLSVSLGQTNDVCNAILGEEVMDIEYSNSWDGYMTDQEMLELTEGMMNWNRVAGWMSWFWRFNAWVRSLI